jgi:hypothetical protein
MTEGKTLGEAETIREPVWFRTDEKDEALWALQEVHNQLVKLDEQGNLYPWKWIITALHNALQGFMVWTIRRGHDRDIISNKVYREVRVEGLTAEILLWIDQKWRKFLDRRLNRKKYSQVYQ